MVYDEDCILVHWERWEPLTKVGPQYHALHQITSRWSKELKVKSETENMEEIYKSETVNILEENTRKCFHNLGVEKTFLSMMQKIETNKDFKILTM